MLSRWSFGGRSYRQPETDSGADRRSLFVYIRGTNMARAHVSEVYMVLADGSGFFTTLAFWLRSSVVSVLNSLTTIMKAPPSLLVI